MSYNCHSEKSQMYLRCSNTINHPLYLKNYFLYNYFLPYILHTETFCSSVTKTEIFFSTAFKVIYFRLFISWSSQLSFWLIFLQTKSGDFSHFLSQKATTSPDQTFHDDCSQDCLFLKVTEYVKNLVPASTVWHANV